jgi:hypothetical protein
MSPETRGSLWKADIFRLTPLGNEVTFDSVHYSELDFVTDFTYLLAL